MPINEKQTSPSFSLFSLLLIMTLSGRQPGRERWELGDFQGLLTIVLGQYEAEKRLCMFSYKENHD